jgi:hypothetical protein
MAYSFSEPTVSAKFGSGGNTAGYKFLDKAAAARMARVGTGTGTGKGAGTGAKGAAVNPAGDTAVKESRKKFSF